MNRLLACLMLIVAFASRVEAQAPNFGGWAQNYLTITSYNDNIYPDHILLRFEKSGIVDVKSWKILVRTIATPIDGRVFPADKIALIPSSIQTGAFPTPTPTFSQMGVLPVVSFAEGIEMPIVPLSGYHLRNAESGYYELRMNFNIRIQGGKYMDALKKWAEYPLRFVFSFYGPNNEKLGEKIIEYRFQINGNFTGTPPVENYQTIQVSATARQGQLILTTLTDYINGAAVTYNNALKVKSNTGYQVSIKSISPTFVSPSDRKLPLDVVKIQLQPLAENNAATYVKSLSTVQQQIASGSATAETEKSFNIRYFTSSNDERLVMAPPDNYATTLQYTITPQ